MRWLVASTFLAAALGVAGLAWLGTQAWSLVLPLAALAALPLLPARGACGHCQARPDPRLGFCPGCAR